MEPNRPHKFAEMFTLLVALSALAGAAGGFFLGRNLVSGSDQTLGVLSDLLRALIGSQNSGPIIAVGIAAAASIAGAVIVPAVTVFALEFVHHNHKEMTHETDRPET